ncbi:MAG: DUF808 domain-containing protein [Methylococcales bacterium]|nr:DUF808 domain-containing protein [Methylococcales bacterium]MBT4032295.1 DUF808 domain-containing protein [Methylococcales bacterium]
MASGFFAVLDDVAMLLDDAALMSKVAVKKTVGLLGDDLAVNAEKATDFPASRELPVIWAITKGSVVNKLIILPIVFLLSSYLPDLIVPILLGGGAYLSYEGVEKFFEWFSLHCVKEGVADQSPTIAGNTQPEATKIKSAIRTDFILSIEIIVISLETVIDQVLPVQIMVVSFIALLATVGVYGFVAFLVRMDDVGLYLIKRSIQLKGLGARSLRLTGDVLVASLPKVIRLLAVIGTVAMLVVGGGMFVHNIDAVHYVLAFLPSLLADLVSGLIVGSALLRGLQILQSLLNRRLSGI